jgi:hypothetical protein
MTKINKKPESDFGADAEKFKKVVLQRKELSAQASKAVEFVDKILKKLAKKYGS